jgi:Flp pilus assembly CpaE family ATPase
MADAIRLLLIEDNPGDRRLVREYLRDCGEQYSVEEAATLVHGLEFLARSHFDLVLTDAGLPDSQGMQTIATLRAHAPDVPLILLTGNDDDTMASFAVQSGAQDFLVKGRIDSQSLSRAIRHALLRHQRNAGNEPSREAARVVGVLGARGGVGVTTVAAYLGAELSQFPNHRVLLGDLDVNGGSLGFLVKPKRQDSLARVLMNLHRLDRAFWDSAISPQSETLHVLESADGVPAMADAAAIRVVIRFARPLYSWIVLDLGRPNALNTGLLDECSDLLLVTTSAVPVMHTAKRVALHLDRRPNVKLLLTQDRDNSELSFKDIQELLGIADCRRLPTADRELHEAWVSGRMLSETGALRRELSKLAAELSGHAAAPHNGLNRLSKILSLVSSAVQSPRADMPHDRTPAR